MTLRKRSTAGSLLAAVLAWSVAGDCAAGDEYLVFPVPKATPADALCGANRIDFSPDGRFLASYASRGFFPFRHPNPDLAILDVDCLIENDFAKACMLSATEANGPVREIAWATDSSSILAYAPAISLRSLKSPDFSMEGEERLALKSRLLADDMHLEGHATLSDLKRLWPRFQKALGKASSLDRALDIPLSANARNADGLYLSRQDYAPRIKAGATWRAAPLSGAAAASGSKAPSRLLRLGKRRLILTAGELVAVDDGATVATGDRFKLRANGELMAVFDDLDTITEFAPGGATATRRAIDRRPGEALIDFSRAEGRDAVAHHYEAPYGDARVRLEVEGRARELVCKRKEGSSVAVEMQTVRLGPADRPMAATLFKTSAPKGLVVYAPGGPGALSTGAARALLVGPFVEEGWDVLMMTASGNSGAGRATVDRLARDGGAAVEADADAILAAVEAKAFGDYPRAIFYGESYGGVLALTTLNRMQGRKPVFERFLMGAPWLKPKAPESWADTRGPQQALPASQAAWEKAAVGIDWSLPTDAYRDWAAAQRAAMPCSADVAIYYSLTDPTFEAGDIACQAGPNFTFTTKAKGSHMVALAGVGAWIKAQLAALPRTAPPT